MDDTCIRCKCLLRTNVNKFDIEKNEKIAKRSKTMITLNLMWLKTLKFGMQAIVKTLYSENIVFKIYEFQMGGK